MTVYKIAVIPGDGKRPEVTLEAVRVLKAAADKFGFDIDCNRTVVADYRISG
jgi:isocitrate/isopropylmalate dehydrogenase